MIVLTLVHKHTYYDYGIDGEVVNYHSINTIYNNTLEDTKEVLYTTYMNYLQITSYHTNYNNLKDKNTDFELSDVIINEELDDKGYYFIEVHSVTDTENFSIENDINLTKELNEYVVQVGEDYKKKIINSLEKDFIQYKNKLLLLLNNDEYKKYLELRDKFYKKTYAFNEHRIKGV